ncbi:MAG: hypothetical protein AAF412_06750, partial [Pseudomonadota bacterium]
MHSIGFGLERIGVAALRFPIAFAAVVVTVTFAALYFIPSVGFNGSVTGVLPKNSENFLAYEAQKRDFRNFSRDVAILIRSEKFQTADGLEALRDLQLDLSLEDGVTSAISIMAIPQLDENTGELQSYFPGELGSDADAMARLDRLITEFPQAKSLFSKEADTAVILVALDIPGDNGNDQQAFDIFKGLVAVAQDIADPSFEISYAGLTPMGITILETLLTDQVRLTLFGLALGGIIAIAFFRSLVAALFCAVPPILTAIWSIGFFGAAGISVTYMTTILPTLALVLSYADGIVLFHRWNKRNRDGDHDKAQLRDNLEDAILRVGPASALTSFTTAIALSSFAVADSEALVEFAWVGIFLVSFAFLSVIVSIPLMGLAMIRAGWVSTGTRVSSSFRFGSIAAAIYERAPVGISICALAAIISFLFAHLKLEPDYTVTDLLPRDSDSYRAEQISNKVFGGRSLIFFQVPTVEAGGLAIAANRDRLSEVSALLKKTYGDDRVYSIDSIWDGRSERVKEIIFEKLQDAPEYMRQGYLSGDGKHMLVSVRVPSSQSISGTQVMLGDIENTLQVLSFKDDVVVTGFPVLLATEFSRMINELRVNLLYAALLGIVLIGFATRSVFCAAVVAVPNLFPILFIEAVIYLGIGSIGVTEVVALTLAFGIAID